MANIQEEKWKAKHTKAIKECVTDEQLGVVIDLIYSDGFQDGKDEGEDADDREPLPWHELD